jgi:hypothetical protein
VEKWQERWIKVKFTVRTGTGLVPEPYDSEHVWRETFEETSCIYPREKVSSGNIKTRKEESKGVEDPLSSTDS